jgi:hypothetical protein
MKRWLHNFISGAGTLLEIMPPPTQRVSAGRRILAKSDAELFYEDWEKIGGDFWAALGKPRPDANGNGQSPGRARPPGTLPPG